jgi:hypothetical protein
MGERPADWISTQLPTGEVIRWKPVFVGASFRFGVDEIGRRVQYVAARDEVLVADESNMLFFLPLLDMNPTELFEQMRGATNVAGELDGHTLNIVQQLIRVGLKQRAQTYIGRAITWLGVVRPDVETCRMRKERVKRHLCSFADRSMPDRRLSPAQLMRAMAQTAR